MLDVSGIINRIYRVYPLWSDIQSYISKQYDPAINQPLALSGSLFIVSAWTAFAYENYITGLLSFILSLTSVNYHLDHNPVSYVCDQIALFSVVIRSFFDGYSGGLHGLIIFFAINTYNWMVYFSPIGLSLASNSDRSVANPWHMSIHLFAILAIIVQQYCIANYSSPILDNDSSLSVL
jgi:hypothetical protein